MLEKLIGYFTRRHLLSNFILILVFIGGVYFWNTTIKENMPDVSFNLIRITTVYPGANPEEVEYFVTKPIEDSLRSVEGVYRITSSSSSGSSSVTVELEQNVKNLDSAVNEVKNAVLSVRLPDEVSDVPRVWLMRTTRRPVLNVAVVDTNHRLLKDSERRELQRYALALENRILNLPEIGEVRRTGWLQREMQVNLKPDRLKWYNIPVSTVIAKIRAHNLRQPAGSLEDAEESKVTLSSPLYTAGEIEALIVQAGFEGQRVMLRDIASVGEGFEKNRAIVKIDGYEAVILNAVKSHAAGVIRAVDRLQETCRRFERDNLAGTGLKVFFMSDGSTDVRNRLNIIKWNSLIGFSFILIVLFIFMDFRSGVWVALGIPFTFCFTMAVASLMGFTINNMTLAAAIIVMGMIVDDAIVIAENIARKESLGIDPEKAAVLGTTEMFLPVLGSVLTTMVAFLPLMLMQGRFVRMIQVIPPIVWLMLLASLIESVLILPGHMKVYFSRKVLTVMTFGLLPVFERLFRRKGRPEGQPAEKGHWFFKIEDAYGRFLKRILPRKGWIFLGFVLLLTAAGMVFSFRMKYVMFPNEEATEIRLLAAAAEGTKRIQTAELSRQLERIIEPYLGNEVIGFRTDIARSRWGGAAEENRLTMYIEVVSREKRKKSLNQLVREWEQQFEGITDFTELRFSRQRFGAGSGSPIELVFTDNNEEARTSAVGEAYRIMSRDPLLANVEIERIPPNPEYRVKVNRSLAESLGIDVSRIALTLRTILGGTVAYEIPSGDEELPLKVSVDNSDKDDIEKILDVPVENQGRYLVPLGRILDLKKGMAPSTINREDFRRVTKIYADIAGSRQEQEKQAARNGNNRQNGAPARTAGPTGGEVSRKDSPSSVQQGKAPESGKPGSISSPDRTGGSVGQPPETAATAPQPKKGRVPTPLEIADRYEKDVLPALAVKYPSTVAYFGGEVQNSRESQGEFKFALWMVVGLIYMILALLFNSAIKPFVILLSVPFGIVGVIFAFQIHGIAEYGFFAVIGVIGLLGVVVNDSIVMISKLDEEFEKKMTPADDSAIADVAKTRLRAVVLTTLTTVAGLFPTAYGLAGYDSMLAEMMLAMGWGLIFSSLITLLLVPSIYSVLMNLKYRIKAFRLRKTGPAAVLPFFLLLLMAGSAAEIRAGETLSLGDFLERSQRANPVFGTFLIDAVNAEYAKVLKKPASDFVLSVAAKSRLDFGEGEKFSPSLSAAAGLPLAPLGLNLSGRWDMTGGANPVSSLEAGVSVAVLRNMFGRAERLQTRSADLEARIAAYKVAEAFEDYAGSMAALWHDWVAARIQLDFSRLFFEENGKLLDNIRQKNRQGVADAADVARIELQVREKRNALIAASNVWLKTTDRIREVTGAGRDEVLLPSALIPQSGPSGSFEELFAMATNGRTWKILALLRQKNADDLALLKENLIPSWDLGIYYARSFSDGGLPPTASADGPGMRLSFVLPAYKRSIASWRIGQGEAGKQELTLRGSAAAYRTALHNLYRDIETERLLLNSAGEEIKLAERILSAERRNYDFGRITLSQYITVVNDLERRRLDRILREISLEKKNLDWLRLTDALVAELPGR